jgi:chromosome partition protein MukB
MTKRSRARIQSSVLVNWNGFFFQHFEMDGGVTALEGENGAGKTTVMIAAYVALLPDQRLLQFRNVSEAGSAEGDRGAGSEGSCLFRPGASRTQGRTGAGRRNAPQKRPRASKSSLSSSRGSPGSRTVRMMSG